jgi:hypothetical protein
MRDGDEETPEIRVRAPGLQFSIFSGSEKLKTEAPRPFRVKAVLAHSADAQHFYGASKLTA